MTGSLLPAHRVRRAGEWRHAVASVSLTYEDRFLRRKRLAAADGQDVLVDLAETVSLNHGDALELADGRLVEVVAAPEAVLVVTGPHLIRYAWHIGNRHAPCQIEHHRLLVQEDHVIAEMLRGLGARVVHATEPFNPAGGAYGHGRTLPHRHGPT